MCWLFICLAFATPLWATSDASLAHHQRPSDQVVSSPRPLLRARYPLQCNHSFPSASGGRTAAPRHCSLCSSRSSPRNWRLESTFGEFVEGLDKQAASFPLTLKDLKLKEKRIQEELDEDGKFPFDLTDGRIGHITVTPGWMGTVEVVASQVVLNFSFSAMKAMNNAMKKDSGARCGEGDRFCQRHFTSQQREKIDPVMRPCQKCGAQITSTYASMTLCPPCSNTEESCMICGDHAPVASNYIPPKTLSSQPPTMPPGMVYAMPDKPPGSTLPPPPPSAQSPSRMSAQRDFDWPRAAARVVRHEGSVKQKGGGLQPEHRSKESLRAERSRQEKGPSGLLAQAELPAARAGASDVRAAERSQVSRPGTWEVMYGSASSQLDGILDYLGNLPALDLSAWTTCLNSDANRDINRDVKDLGMSPTALSATRELDRMAQVEAKLRTVVGAKNEVIDELKANKGASGGSSVEEDELGRREQEILEDRILRAEVPSDGAVTLAVTAPRAAPEASGSRHQGLAIVADDGFRVRYQLQIQSLRCYARAQGYDFWLLQGSEFPECQPPPASSKLLARGTGEGTSAEGIGCQKLELQGIVLRDSAVWYSSVEDFFFQKHCAIANLLEQQEDRYALAVLDADVVAVDLDRSLDMWMGSQGDLQFYKRITGEEVMAGTAVKGVEWSGNYIARNRPWVRQFLRNWASFKWRRPPGFSSADNGALHVALMEALERPEATRVAELYGNLTAMVEALRAKRCSAWTIRRPLAGQVHVMDHSFWALAMQPSNTTKKTAYFPEVLSIWPRMSFFVDDGVYLNRSVVLATPRDEDPQDLPRYFADLDACRANRGADGAWVSPDVGLQFSISGYLLREIPHLEPCKGICVNLQWMTVGVFTGEIIKDLAETGNMRKWIWQATYVKYLKCEGTPSQYDEMIWKQPEKSFGAFIILCKFLIALYLLFVGNRFILKSENNKDLVLNCVKKLQPCTIEWKFREAKTEGKIFALVARPASWVALVCAFVSIDNDCNWATHFVPHQDRAKEGYRDLYQQGGQLHMRSTGVNEERAECRVGEIAGGCLHTALHTHAYSFAIVDADPNKRKQRLVPVGPPPQAAPESEYVLEPVWMAQTVWGGLHRRFFRDWTGDPEVLSSRADRHPLGAEEAIEWGDLYRATNRDNTPTPGYLFNDIVQNVSNASPSAIPEVAQYLIDCVNGDHAIPPFQQAFLSQPDGWSSVLEASVFTGPPSPMFGDEPYRLVREAAEGAKEALETTEFYHQDREYKELSQRIVGFGNYQPPEDTKLPDGSVNVAKDVTFGDVLGTAVGGVLNGAGAIFQGVKAQRMRSPPGPTRAIGTGSEGRKSSCFF
ncbi:Uncharacterized protein SCF082_LOCUS17955 [Durusdinium trenchii]|uniref:Uncharacterized protein n=1 Tax=Durusdinium trenchii TaxID=1381693 RepID=A0ABP0KNG1_9DINO